MRVPALLAFLASATAASAQPVASGVEPERRTLESPQHEPIVAPTTVPIPIEEADWEAAPSPRDAGGVVREDARPRTDTVLWIPRTLLFLPRMAVWLAAQPIRGAAYAYERYSPKPSSGGAAKRRTIGLVPTAVYESGFGFSAGARLSVGNIFGAGEQVTARAEFLGRYRQAYGLALRSGDRLGKRFSLELDATYEQRPREQFFGIGNDTGDALEARYGEDLIRNVLVADVRVIEHLHARSSFIQMLRDFSDTDDADSIEMVYDTSTLGGFDSGVDQFSLDEELVYDSRRSSRYQSKVFDSTGWFARVHIGVARGIEDDPTQLYSYGGEVQRYFDLYDGSRVLVLRALVEAVDGDTVPFIDLPQLGGTEYLRGYPTGRFRDRAITLGTAQYNWDLGNYMSAFTFIDAGRPHDALDDLADGPLRIGFGGGVEAHTGKSFMARVMLAGSRDGDFFVELALTPADGRRERAARY